MWPWSTGLHWAAVQQDDISKPLCFSPPWWRRSSRHSYTGRRRCRWGMGCPSPHWSGGGWWSADSCHSAASSSDLQVGEDSGPHGETWVDRQTWGEKRRKALESRTPLCYLSRSSLRTVLLTPPPRGGNVAAGEAGRDQRRPGQRAVGPTYLGRQPGCHWAVLPCCPPASRCTGSSRRSCPLQNSIVQISFCLFLNKPSPCPPEAALAAFKWDFHV